MAGTFDARMRELGERVGDGPLVGSVYRPGPYAAVQEADLSLHHPRGGQALFQTTALFTGHRAALERVAATVLEPGGPAVGMAEGMAAINDRAAELAPKETTALARSGRVRVYDNGRVVHDSGPTSTGPAGPRGRGRQRGRGGGRRGGNRGRQ